MFWHSYSQFQGRSLFSDIPLCVSSVPSVVKTTLSESPASGAATRSLPEKRIISWTSPLSTLSYTYRISYKNSLYFDSWISSINRMTSFLKGCSGPASIQSHLDHPQRGGVYGYHSTLKHLGRQLMKLDNPDDFAGLVKKALE